MPNATNNVEDAKLKRGSQLEIGKSECRKAEAGSPVRPNRLDRRETASARPTPATSIRTHAVGHLGRKRLGEASEAAFLARASGLGFPVSRPWGECEPYDALVGFGQTFWRVQVKCTQRFGEGRYRVKNGGANGQPYTADEIDFIAAHIVPLDLWYIIPVNAAGSRKGLHFYPHGSRNGLLEKYREAWCLLACPPKARGWKDVPPVCRCRELPVRCAVCPRRT